jgi:hypothetical protein
MIPSSLTTLRLHVTAIQYKCGDLSHLECRCHDALIVKSVNLEHVLLKLTLNAGPSSHVHALMSLYFWSSNRREGLYSIADSLVRIITSLHSTVKITPRHLAWPLYFYQILILLLIIS